MIPFLLQITLALSPGVQSWADHVAQECTDPATGAPDADCEDCVLDEYPEPPSESDDWVFVDASRACDEIEFDEPNEWWGPGDSVQWMCCTADLSICWPKHPVVACNSSQQLLDCAWGVNNWDGTVTCFQLEP